jgi:hypothetical protein
MDVSEQILEAVMDLKGDVGGVVARLDALDAWMKEHAAQDQAAHARIQAMEITQAKARGAASVWTMLAIGIGTGVGYLIELLVTIFKK